MRKRILVFLVVILTTSQVLAQVVPKFFTVLTSPNSTGDFKVSDAGFVRLNLTTSDGSWRFLLVDSTGKRTIISDETYERFQIYPGTIELPIASSGKVHIESQGSLTKIIWESFIPELTGKPLFRQGGPLELLDSAFRADPVNNKIVMFSAAVVRVRWAAPSRSTRWCTGVQIEPGTILTNRHCLPPDFNLSTPQGEVAVQFGEFSKGLGDVAETIPASVSIAQKSNGQGDTYKRDMAILKLKFQPQSELYKKTVIPLAEVSTPDKQSVLLSVWSYDSPMGKVVSRGPLCKANLGQEAAWNCDKPVGFYHQCETEEGSSGSPIIDVDSGKLIGLHYLGVAPNGGNCALRVEEIKKELQSSL